MNKQEGELIGWHRITVRQRRRDKSLGWYVRAVIKSEDDAWEYAASYDGKTKISVIKPGEPITNAFIKGTNE